MASTHKVLTEKVVGNLKSGKEREHHWDSKVPHFGVRVESSGRKAYVWYAKVNGKPRFRACGEYPNTSLADARTEAEKWTGVAAAWKAAKYAPPDPFDKARVAPLEPTNTPTFKAMIDAYVEHHVKVTANRPADAEADVRWIVKKHFGAWTALPVDSITVENVLAVKNACGKKRYMANRCVEFVKCVYNWSAGKTDGRIHFWPVDNPAKDVALFDETKRERFLQPDELLRFNEALANEPSADLKDFLVLAITTGARRENIMSMRWQDVQWERAAWEIPLSKNGESYTVQLLPAALDTLKARRKVAADDVIWVFPGVGASGHLIDLKKRWDAFRKRSKLTDVRIHDLRRTCASYLAIAGVSLQQIAASLGHKSMQSTLIYAKLADSAVRDAREVGAAKMISMMAAAKKRQKTLAGKRVRPMLAAASS